MFYHKKEKNGYVEGKKVRDCEYKIRFYLELISNRSILDNIDTIQLIKELNDLELSILDYSMISHKYDEPQQNIQEVSDIFKEAKERYEFFIKRRPIKSKVIDLAQRLKGK